MKMLRQLTVLLALALAPLAFGATITAQSAVTYSVDGSIMTLNAGDVLEIPDGATFELVRGAVSVTGTAKVNAGNGTATVTGGSMFVQVQGDRARVSNVGTGSGTVSFEKPNGEVTSISAGSEVFSAVAGADTLVVLVEDINAVDLPDFDVDPVVGTAL
jgi:ferric-dicitrate binding protein FerR (iron transport regulator)